MLMLDRSTLSKSVTEYLRVLAEFVSQTQIKIELEDHIHQVVLHAICQIDGLKNKSSTLGERQYAAFGNISVFVIWCGRLQHHICLIEIYMLNVIDPVTNR